MALVLGDNFSYQGSKPLDARLKYDTVANMKAVADATMYDGCIAYCVEADKTYQWKSTNSADETLGKWREYSSGGGGGTSDYSDLSNKPSIENVTLSGNKSASDLGLVKSSALASVATSGSYNDLSNKPDIPSKTSDLTNDSDFVSSIELSTVARSGSYDDLSDKPTIPSDLDDLSDVALSSPTNGQVLKYNSTTKKFENANESGGGGGSYSAGDGIDITNDVISTKQSEEGDIDEIIDVYPTAGNLVSIVNAFNRGDLYSTDEKMIGQWTDGKPLYQKVLNIGNMPNNTEKIIELSISDFEKAVYVNGISCDLTSSVKITRPIPYIYTPETQYSNALWLQSDNNVWNIHIKTCANRSNEIGIVTIKYTKTTDTAISIGSETEYSTDEKVVGTWIDGSPVYQRTIVQTVNTYSDGGVNNTRRLFLYDLTSIIPNIFVVNGFGKVVDITTTKSGVPSSCAIPCGGYYGLGSSTQCTVFSCIGGASANAVIVGFQQSDLVTSVKFVVTIQYTKTTT